MDERSLTHDTNEKLQNSNQMNADVRLSSQQPDLRFFSRPKMCICLKLTEESKVKNVFPPLKHSTKRQHRWEGAAAAEKTPTACDMDSPVSREKIITLIKKKKKTEYGYN